MSRRHSDSLNDIRLEYDDVVATLRAASANKARGIPGAPAYDSARLVAAIASLGDAYAFLLIAVAEGFLREYLDSVGVLSVSNEIALSASIDRAAKALNESNTKKMIHSKDKGPIHDLRLKRNNYAHGHRKERVSVRSDSRKHAFAIPTSVSII